MSDHSNGSDESYEGSDYDTKAKIVEAFEESNSSLEKKLQNLSNKYKQLKRQILDKEKRSVELGRQLSALQSGNDGLFLYLESQYARKMPIVWWILLAIILTFCAGAMQKQSYFWALCNLVAFLLTWRSLYVLNNRTSIVISICIVLLTIVLAA